MCGSAKIGMHNGSHIASNCFIDAALQQVRVLLVLDHPDRAKLRASASSLAACLRVHTSVARTGRLIRPYGGPPGHAGGRAGVSRGACAGASPSSLQRSRRGLLTGVHFVVNPPTTPEHPEQVLQWLAAELRYFATCPRRHCSRASFPAKSCRPGASCAAALLLRSGASL